MRVGIIGLVILVIAVWAWWNFFRFPPAQQAGHKAFTAIFSETKTALRSSTFRLTLACDGNGLVRMDTSEKPDIFNIWDYNRRSSFIACKSRRVYLDALRINTPLVVPFGGAVMFDEQSIQRVGLMFFKGMQNIGGHQCRDYSGWIFFPRDTAEHWYCQDLGVCVKSKLNLFGEETNDEMAEYSKQQPDPSLFDLRGYRLVGYQEWATLTR